MLQSTQIVAGQRDWFPPEDTYHSAASIHYSVLKKCKFSWADLNPEAISRLIKTPAHSINFLSTGHRKHPFRAL